MTSVKRGPHGPQTQKPDAGASAGDEALAQPVARLDGQGLDIGRQAWPAAIEAKGTPDAANARVIHTPVRVGSAAMPAPFALRSGQNSRSDRQFPCRFAPPPSAKNPARAQLFLITSSHFWGSSFPTGNTATTKSQPGLPFANAALYRRWRCFRQPTSPALMPAASPSGACRCWRCSACSALHRWLHQRLRRPVLPPPGSSLPPAPP